LEECELDIDIGTGLSIFGMAFGGWAAVVAWGIGVIRREVQALKEQIQSTTITQIQHVNQTERRLTMLETEFGFLRRKMDHHHTDGP
jgi:hypothetical protein